jgi:hypothetical protein
MDLAIFIIYLHGGFFRDFEIAYFPVGINLSQQSSGIEEKH